MSSANSLNDRLSSDSVPAGSVPSGESRPAGNVTGSSLPTASEPTSTSSASASGSALGTGGLRVVACRRAKSGALQDGSLGLAARGMLFLSRVEAGFPSPADDYVEGRLDLSEALVQNEEATFFVRVAGGSMTGAGIHDGDILVVDRSVEPSKGDVVIAVLAGELTVKRYEVRSGQPYLVPESADHEPIPVEEGQELRVWGVAQHVVHEVS